MPTLRLANFAGGLNTRDAPNELAPNETPDSVNWTLDVRGAARLRPGCSNIVALPGTSGKAAYIFYSAAIDQWLCARESGGTGTHLFSRPGDLSGSWTDRGTIIGVAATQPVSFVDFPGTAPTVVMTNQASSNGIHLWDGTTFTTNAAPGGSSIALWQNRVWVGGYPSSSATGNPTRLFASKIGDPTVWAAPDGLSVDVRDKDGQGLTGLGIAGGSLIVFKLRSAYRVNDSTTGSYSTIDSAAGCQGPLAVVPLHGRLYTWGADGLYEWNGVGPGVNVGDKTRPLFSTSAGVVGGVPALCGGADEDRALFAYPSVAGGDNDLLLDFDPQHGWAMRYELKDTGRKVTSFTRKNADLYMAVENLDVIYVLYANPASQPHPCMDDGTVVTNNNFRTAWIEPYGGKLCRIWRLAVEGLLENGGINTLTLKVYKDGDLSTSDSYDITADLRASSSTDQTQIAPLHSLGHARSFAFEFVAGAVTLGVTQVNSVRMDWLPLESG